MLFRDTSHYLDSVYHYEMVFLFCSLIPVGLGENIEWRIGNETTRFDDTFYLALLKLICKSNDILIYKYF